MAFQTPSIDLETWERDLQLRERLAPSTANQHRRTLARLQRYGLDITLFLTEPTRGVELATDWLRRAREERGIHAFNLEARSLAAWARTHGARDLPWRTAPSPPSLPTAYSPQELAALARTPAGPRILAAAHYSLATGTRTGEVAALRREDLDFAQRLVAVRHPSKRGPPRWIPPHPSLWDPKRAFQRWFRTLRTDNPIVWPNWREPLAPIAAKNLTTDAYWFSHALGFTFNFHRCRHTRATQLLEQGCDIRYIQAYLGHKSINTTARYAEVRNRAMIDAVRRADEAPETHA